MASLLPAPDGDAPPDGGSGGAAVQAREPSSAPPGARVLVGIPCLNEELALPGMVLLARRHAHDVLVVDDGSQDRTAWVAELAGAHAVRLPRNEGKGSGVRRAFRVAREGGYDALVLMDGDGQHDPEEIPALLEPILREKDAVDMALGFRFGANTEMPLWRRVGKRVLDHATAVSGAGVVTDSQCGFRAFGRRAIVEMDDRLRADGFSIESEQLVAARQAGLALANVPVSCRYVGIDGSTLGPVKHAVGVLGWAARTAARERPGLFAAPGAATLGLAALLLAGGAELEAWPLVALGALLAPLGAAGVWIGVRAPAVEAGAGRDAQPPQSPRRTVVEAR
jgi:hypothetical protein